MLPDLLEIYVDGSCPQAHGVGAWAYAIRLADGEVMTCAHHVEVATNNTMELMAALMALREVKAQGWRSHPIKIVSDSMYVVQGMNSWRKQWAKRDFDGIKNDDLWRRLHAHAERCTDLRFQWVKGHNGHFWNELVDKLAGKAQRAGLIAFPKQPVE